MFLRLLTNSKPYVRKFAAESLSFLLRKGCCRTRYSLYLSHPLSFCVNLYASTRKIRANNLNLTSVSPPTRSFLFPVRPKDVRLVLHTIISVRSPVVNNAYSFNKTYPILATLCTPKFSKHSFISIRTFEIRTRSYAMALVYSKSSLAYIITSC